MKYFVLTLLFICQLTAKANRPSLFHELQRINSYWTYQKDIDGLLIHKPSYVHYSENSLIQLHLKLIEQVLRNRSTEGLSVDQKAARIRNLNHLHEYWNINLYPVNNKLAYRNPVFIDDYNTFCAVGYLIKTSGHEPLARRIARTQNLSYLNDISTNGLNEWVTSSGLTLEELAWIQPAYLATNHSQGLSKGVNGPVYAMTGNDSNQILYVAGYFSQANETVACNNIIQVKYNEANLFSNTFTTLGDGLNGPVYSLARDGNSLYAGGHFSASGNVSLQNIARWNGNTWEPMGNLNGTVYAIHKYKNQIYAGGKFSFAVGNDVFHNLAIWSGTMWLPVVNTVNDTVFAMYTDANRLYIGGAFTKVDTLDANHIIAYNGFYPEQLDEGVKGTVRAISVRPNNAIAVAGDFFTPQRTAFAYAEYFPQSGWSTLDRGFRIDTTNYTNRCYAIAGDIVVGDFKYAGFMYYSHNTAKIPENERWVSGFASTDSTVYCAYKTAKRVFFGGTFSKILDWNNSYPAGYQSIANNLAVWDKDYISVGNIPASTLYSLTLYPNPMDQNVTVKSLANMKSVKVLTLDGKLLFENTFQYKTATYILNRTSIPLSGLYLLVVEDENGNTSNQKLMIN